MESLAMRQKTVKHAARGGTKRKSVITARRRIATVASRRKTIKLAASRRRKEANLAAGQKTKRKTVTLAARRKTVKFAIVMRGEMKQCLMRGGRP